MTYEEKDYTTMRVLRKNLKRLKAHGTMDDNVDEVLCRVLDKAEG